MRRPIAVSRPWPKEARFTCRWRRRSLVELRHGGRPVWPPLDGAGGKIAAQGVYDHVSAPKFRMTATFDQVGGQTRITMRMVFDTAELRRASGPQVRRRPRGQANVGASGRVRVANGLTLAGRYEGCAEGNPAKPIREQERLDRNSHRPGGSRVDSGGRRGPAAGGFSHQPLGCDGSAAG